MVQHTQTICWQFADELFECDHFMILALKGLKSLHEMHHWILITKKATRK